MYVGFNVTRVTASIVVKLLVCYRGFYKFACLLYRLLRVCLFVIQVISSLLVCCTCYYEFACLLYRLLRVCLLVIQVITSLTRSRTLDVYQLIDDLKSQQLLISQVTDVPFSI